MGVPDLAAMSNPVWSELLILLLTPYLDVIVPETGVTANFIPFILGNELYHSSCAFFSFCSSNCFVTFSCIVVLAISISCVFISSSLLVCFSIILKFNSSWLFSSALITLINCSASSIVFTNSTVVLFKAIS